jgi:hypothetical protein
MIHLVIKKIFTCALISHNKADKIWLKTHWSPNFDIILFYFCKILAVIKDGVILPLSLIKTILLKLWKDNYHNKSYEKIERHNDKATHFFFTCPVGQPRYKIYLSDVSFHWYRTIGQTLMSRPEMARIFFY